MAIQGLDPAAQGATPGDQVLSSRLSPRVAPQRPVEAQGGQDGSAPPPEIQEAYNAFVGRASTILWSKPVREKMRDALRRSKDKVSTLGEFSAQVGLRSIRDNAADGLVIPAAVTLQGGQEIVQQAGEIAEKAGVPFEPPELEAAYYLAVDRARTAAQKEGLLDMEAVGRDAQQLEAMKSDGRMEQVWAAIRETQASAKSRPKLPAAKGN